MGQSTEGFAHGLQRGFQTYYFHKLIKYLNRREYCRVTQLHAEVNPQITLPELFFLRWGVRRVHPQAVVETGSFCGASTTLMADVLQQLGCGRLYAIDLFSLASEHHGFTGTDYSRRFDEAVHPYADYVAKVEGDSRSVPWDRSIDFLFIDGDHTKDGVSADIAKYIPFVRTGGHVFLHDYTDNAATNSMVKSAVDELLLSNPSYQLLGVVTSLIGFRKVV